MCFHFRMAQPLWASDNLSKGANLTKIQNLSGNGMGRDGKGRSKDFSMRIS